MTNNHQQATRTGQQDDPLRQIKGIGQKIADTLHSIGIHSLADLAQTTPVDLAQKLSAQAGLKLSSQSIEAQDWIGQARTLAAKQATSVDLPDETVDMDQAELAPASTEPPTGSGWKSYAEFTLFFDYMLDERGEQQWQTRIWQTRVYDGASGEEPSFPGLAPEPWVEWIFKRLGPPALAELTALTSAALTPAPPPASSDTQLEIVEMLVEVVEPGAAVTKRSLVVTVRFNIAGTNASALAASEAPYQVEVHLIDPDRGTTNLASCQRGRLQPDTVDYTSRQIVAIPAVGRYELQSIVFLLPPGEALAVQAGPTLRVLP
jgi:hypothetical protein